MPNAVLLLASEGTVEGEAAARAPQSTRSVAHPAPSRRGIHLEEHEIKLID